MPLKNIPKEIRDEYEKISKRLKEDHPNWSDEKRAKYTWTIIKKRYFKDRDGRWKLKEKYRSSIGEDIDTFLKLYNLKGELEMTEKIKPIHLTAKARILENPPDGVSVDWDKMMKSNITDRIPTFEDILYLQGSLVHSAPFINDNNYSFNPDDLYSVIANGQFSPHNMLMVDVNHQYNPYGAVLDGSAYQENMAQYGEVTTLDFISGIWAWRYPVLAEELRILHENGTLEFSMACGAEAVRCGICNGRFPDLAHACDHILNGESTIHIIRPKFYAASIILGDKTAADRFAKSKEVVGSRGKVESSTWSRTYINDLPDAAFAVVVGGGEKDSDNKTTPRSLRKLPHHNEKVRDGDEQSSVDISHLRNALQRLPVTQLTASDKKKARNHLERHAKALLSTAERDEITSSKEYIAFVKQLEDNEMEKTIEQLEKQIAQFDLDLKAANKKIKEFEAKDQEKLIAEKDQLIADLQASIAEKDQQIETANKELEAEKTGSTEAKEKFEADIEALTKDKEDLENRITKMVGEEKKKAVGARNELRAGKIEELSGALGDKKEEILEKYALTYDEETGEEVGIADDIFNEFIDAVNLGLNSKGTGKVNRSGDSDIPPGGATGNSDSAVDKFFKKLDKSKK